LGDIARIENHRGVRKGVISQHCDDNPIDNGGFLL